MKVDMPLNKETKPNQTNSSLLNFWIQSKEDNFFLKLFLLHLQYWFIGLVGIVFDNDPGELGSLLGPVILNGPRSRFIKD